MAKLSGVPGVIWDERRKKWNARIKINGIDKHIGHFNDLNSAIKARRGAENISTIDELDDYISRMKKTESSDLPKSGIPGVSWHKAAKKWQAQIKHNGKITYLGIYDDIDDAIKARKAAES